MTVVNMSFIRNRDDNNASLSGSLKKTAEELAGLMRHSLELVNGQPVSRQSNEDAPTSKTP